MHKQPTWTLGLWLITLLLLLTVPDPVRGQEASQFALPGIPDGLGWYEDTVHYYVYVNHELEDTTTTYLTTDTGAGGPRLQGARVSLLRFDKNWENPAGKNLITRVLDGSTTYLLDSSAGTAAYVDVAAGEKTLVFDRFCSGSLAVTGFVDDAGATVPVWFAPEETGNGRGYAVYPDGTAVALRGLGRFAKEQIVAALDYRAENSQATALLVTEDLADGELYLYLGTQTAADPNGFQDGQLYVLRLTDGAGVHIAREADMPAGPVLGHWTAIDPSVDLDSAAALSTWVNANQRSTNFWRLEDIAEDPANPGTFYVATTGGGDGNRNGMLHRLILADPPMGTATVERLLVGSESDTDSTGRYYDNLTVDSGGRVIIQEDGGGSEVIAYAIASGETSHLFDVVSGGWESSGVINHQTNSYLMSVQAHGTSIPNYGEDGALVLARPAGENARTSIYMTDLTGGYYALADLLTVGSAIELLPGVPAPLSPARPAPWWVLLLLAALFIIGWLLWRGRRLADRA